MKRKIKQISFFMIPTALLVVLGGLFVGQLDILSPQSKSSTSSKASSSARSSSQRQGEIKAPDFSLPDSRGEILTLSDLEGKVVVINFWATWCAPCRAEIPGFLEVYQQYHPKGLEIVGISLDEDGWGVVKEFIDAFEISYPVVLGDVEVVRKYGGIQAIPTTFIVDRNGYVVYGHRGYFSKAQFAEKIEALL